MAYRIDQLTAAGTVDLATWLVEVYDPVAAGSRKLTLEELTDLMTKDYYLEVAKGNVTGHSLVNKFGFNSAIGATLEPICPGGVYQTPTTGQSIEIVSTSTADAAAGAGARTVQVEGLDGSWALQTQTVTMTGTTAAAISGTWTRVFRAKVTESGTYATATAGSHVGTLTIRTASAGATWAQIGLSTSGFPLGQTEIGVYTVPAGSTGYLLSKHASIESAKTPNILWFRRENVDDVSVPYDSMRLFERHNGAAAEITYMPPAPNLTLPEKTDIGAMAYVSPGSAAAAVEFQLVLVVN
jgi:hypothetical protein